MDGLGRFSVARKPITRREGVAARHWKYVRLRGIVREAARDLAADELSCCNRGCRVVKSGDHQRRMFIFGRNAR